MKTDSKKTERKRKIIKVRKRGRMTKCHYDRKIVKFVKT